MDHEEALQAQAVERYLLGEMAGSERDAFEEHYFTCTECAEALTAGAILADNARDVFKQREQKHSDPAAWGWLRNWFSRQARQAMVPALAALALLMIAGYLELVTVPRLKDRLAAATAAQPIAVFALHPASRGAGQVISVPEGARFYTIFVDLPPVSAAAYYCEIRDASGSLRVSLKVPRSETSDTLDLLLDASRTPPGEYTLVVRTSPDASSEVGRYRFAVEFK